MLRLPLFDTRSPQSLEELVAAAAEPGARLVAGGTDILPNLKHRLDAPDLLVSVDQVSELQSIRWEDSEKLLRVGAGVTLSTIAEDARIASDFPSFARAASLVASPLIRNMATLGGNVNLDTRCRYVNQSEFWRSSIGGCLKSEGDVCHVVPKGRSCVAAMSSDTVPPLITLNASLRQVGPEGERIVPLAEYFQTDGIAHLLRKPGEVTAEILIPYPGEGARACYTKWTVRKSIDFPLISIAMNLSVNSAGMISDAKICLGVLAAKPKQLRCDSVIGLELSAPDTAQKIGELCFAQGKTLDNVPYEAGYRRKMLRVFARRAVVDLVAETKN